MKYMLYFFLLGNSGRGAGTVASGGGINIFIKKFHFFPARIFFLVFLSFSSKIV